MPSGPPELRAKWGDDLAAIEHLESRGFKHAAGFCWLQPEGHVYSQDDHSALDYLVLEWDWGDVLNAPKP